MHSSSRCKNRTYLYETANYPVLCKPIYGRVRKFAEIRVYLSRWYCVCTKAMFVSKGSYRYGESIMHFSRQCKNRSYLCWTAYYTVLCMTVWGRERKFEEIRVYLSPWYRVCTKAKFISKGSCRNVESKNAFL